jgi:hypothetical protein
MYVVIHFHVIFELIEIELQLVCYKFAWFGENYVLS